MSAVENLFIIRGKRYVCEKLTATFTSQGMSQLIKGSFYPVFRSSIYAKKCFNLCPNICI